MELVPITLDFLMLSRNAASSAFVKQTVPLLTFTSLVCLTLISHLFNLGHVNGYSEHDSIRCEQVFYVNLVLLSAFKEIRITLMVIAP